MTRMSLLGSRKESDRIRFTRHISVNRYTGQGRIVTIQFLEKFDQ
jgi:hypothetical protein